MRTNKNATSPDVVGCCERKSNREMSVTPLNYAEVWRAAFSCWRPSVQARRQETMAFMGRVSSNVRASG